MDLLKLTAKKRYYFLGIGGIGMSALARYFKVKGCDVGGYDRTNTALTDKLSLEGIEVNFCDSEDAIPQRFRDKTEVLIVRTPAVPVENRQLQWFESNGFVVCKRSELLGVITRTQKGICVAGTHGKTTISTMVAHILRSSTLDCNAFLGGISKNYETNLLTSAKSDLAVIEADEFDRSFHTLEPWIASISSIDADHLDIYGSYEAIKESFADFTKLINNEGALIVKKEIDFTPVLKDGVDIFTYSLNDEDADYYASNIECLKGVYHFDLNLPDGEVISSLMLGVPGLVNLENAVVASAIALQLGVTPEELSKALNSFKGVVRRLDVRFRNDNVFYIDDYAHHPKEIAAVVNSLRDMMPTCKITGVFQPHLFSRTQDFADDFAESLSLLDELILLDIYPAREKPIPGVTAELIFDKVSLKEKVLVSKEQVLSTLENRVLEVLITMGAGDIDRLASPIASMLEQQKER